MAGRKGGGLVPGGSPRGQTWGSPPAHRSGSSSNPAGGNGGASWDGNPSGGANGGNGAAGGNGAFSAAGGNGVHSGSDSLTAGNGGASAPSTPEITPSDLPTRLGITTRPSSGPLQVNTSIPHHACHVQVTTQSVREHFTRLTGRAHAIMCLRSQPKCSSSV